MKKKQLSQAKQWIIEQCQKLNFGRITLQVSHGEPDLTCSWHSRRTVKLDGGDNGPRSEATRADFELCEGQKALLNALNQVNDGACVTVEVRHGLPFLVEIEQDHKAA